MKEGLRHPFGLTLFAMSMALALLAVLYAPLERWSGWAWTFTVWGAACYLATAIAVSRTRPTPREPELKRLDSVRRMIKAKRDECRSGETWPYSTVTRALGDAYEHLDRRIMPAIAELIQKQNVLDADLKSFRDGTVEPPEPKRLERLEQMYSRRKATIEECVQQASNSASTLIEMLNSDQTPELVRSIELWAGELEATYEAITRVMQGTVEANTQGEDAGGPTLSAEMLYEPLETALRQLNPATKLVGCELTELLPNLVDAGCAMNTNGTGLSAHEPTPVERAHATRTIVVDSVEAMRPPGVASVIDPAAIHYAILREQYVLGRPVTQVRMRLSIEEATYYRERRKAITALASELTERELR